MLLYRFIPIHAPCMDQGLLESRSSLPIFGKAFVYLYTEPQSDLPFEIPFALLFILVACTINCWNLNWLDSDSNPH